MQHRNHHQNFNSPYCGSRTKNWRWKRRATRLFGEVVRMNVACFWSVSWQQSGPITTSFRSSLLMPVLWWASHCHNPATRALILPRPPSGQWQHNSFIVHHTLLTALPTTATQLCSFLSPGARNSAPCNSWMMHWTKACLLRVLVADAWPQMKEYAAVAKLTIGSLVLLPDLVSPCRLLWVWLLEVSVHGRIRRASSRSLIFMRFASIGILA